MSLHANENGSGHGYCHLVNADGLRDGMANV